MRFSAKHALMLSSRNFTTMPPADRSGQKTVSPMDKILQLETLFLGPNQEILTLDPEILTLDPEILTLETDFLTSNLEILALETLFLGLNQEILTPNLEKDPPDHQKELLAPQKRAPED